MPTRPATKIIQNRHFLTTTPEKSVRAVAAHMRDNNEGSVLVVSPEDGRLLGICTERDLTFKVLAAGLDANTTPGPLGDDGQPAGCRPGRSSLVMRCTSCMKAVSAICRSSCPMAGRSGCCRHAMHWGWRPSTS